MEVIDLKDYDSSIPASINFILPAVENKHILIFLYHPDPRSESCPVLKMSLDDYKVESFKKEKL